LSSDVRWDVEKFDRLNRNKMNDQNVLNFQMGISDAIQCEQEISFLFQQKIFCRFNLSRDIYRITIASIRIPRISPETKRYLNAENAGLGKGHERVEQLKRDGNCVNNRSELGFMSRECGSG
jgi:hypothetical protein